MSWPTSQAERRVNLLASLDHTLGALVHPDVRDDPIDAALHKSFLATRLGLSLGALALAPLCLVSGGPPAAWEAAALGCLALPIAAAAHLSRSGDLATAEALSLAAWIGIAASAAWGTGSGLALGLLLLVPVEAACAASASVAVLGIAVAGAALAALACGLGSSGAAASAGPGGVAAFAAALGYGGLLSIASARIARLRGASERHSRQRYAALAEAIDEVVVEFDRSGTSCSAGPAASRLFALDPRDLAGRGFFERLHVADRPVFLKLVADIAAGAAPGTATLRLRTGRTLRSRRGDFDEAVFAWIDLGLRPPPLGPAPGQARAPAVVGSLRDVSGRVEAERLAAEVQAASDRTHAGRDLFLANVSHELRTPLNAIIGFSEMLSDAALTPSDPGKRRDYAGIIRQSGLHLLSVVNGILDASKIQSGNFDIVPEAFDLGALIHLSCDMVGLKAEQSRVELVRHVAASTGEIVGDQRACKQILLNLVSNAVKFTPAGGRVTVAARPDGDAVLITVADTGVGIAAADLPRLGDPFFQARASYDRPNDGTGLGLSVVRGLVGLHGGGIRIESAPGEGTRVTVRLPADCRRAASAPGTVTKIETISRYSSALRRGDRPSGGRMHKIA